MGLLNRLMPVFCSAQPQRPIRGVIADYQQFEGARGPIETSMARLAAAWGGRNRESRAVDLGIALESMLMFEVGTGGREPSTEIRYKLGLRAAWLAGNEFADRESVFRSVRQLYDLRSQAAHAGRVSVSSNNWQAVNEKIEAGIALTGQLIITLLSRGSWPDWNRLVLGGR
jgi:hypothetical protein